MPMVLTVTLGSQIWPRKKICLEKYILFNGNVGWRWGKGRAVMVRVASWSVWEFSSISRPFMTANALSPWMISNIPQDQKHVILSTRFGSHLQESWAFQFNHWLKKMGKKKVTQRNLLSLPFFKMMNAFLRQIHHWSLEGGNVKKSYGLLAFTS